MKRRVVVLGVCLLLALAAFAQSDRGTISGTVFDPTGAAVPSANVTARNIATGAQFSTVSTDTGNYTISSVNAGMYEVVVEAAGFKKFTRSGIQVQVAETARIDVVIEVGAATESITVNAAAPLLDLENAEMSTNLAGNLLNALPLNFTKLTGGAIRNPMAFINLAPGGYYVPGSTNTLKINGTPTTTNKIMLDGQDFTNGLSTGNSDVNQPSVEAVEEFTLQVSNFSAEFGQVVGGLFNFTARSGTNEFHGAGYEYFNNAVFNAGQPYTNNGSGKLIRQPWTKNDFGFRVGGPVWIPKVYNGRNRTFFYFNMEVYRNTNVQSGVYATVPTDAMRQGNFGSILTGRTLATDTLGAPIMENTVYDPGTNQVVNGVNVRTPFPGNVIPQSRLNPISLKIQALIPEPTFSGLAVNNWAQNTVFQKNQKLPSIKIDHNFTSSSKLSFYFNYEGTKTYSSPDGLPIPISGFRDQYLTDNSFRLNYDLTVTPRLLLHIGIGEQRYLNPDSAPNSILGYDSVGKLGLVGGLVNSTGETGFPRITGLSGSLGGMSLGMGPTNSNHYHTDKPTAVINSTYVRGNHTYKIGAEYKFDTFTNFSDNNSFGNYVFAATETGLPSTNGQNLSGGNVGYGYASFLLGLVDSASIGNFISPQYRKAGYSLFIQDTWKASRKLTVDYGLRWDLQQAPYEMHNRLSMFSPSVANPSAGGLLGGSVYDGSGPGRCNCSFTPTYPYAIGPRLGVAYQIDPNTVARLGFGVTYGITPQFSYQGATLGVGWNTVTQASTSYGFPAFNWSNGFQYNAASLTAVTLDPGVAPLPGQINNASNYLDHNASRPTRLPMWNISLQRSITPNLSVEAAYVGNRGAWLTANSLENLNALTPQRIAQFGLNVNNAADRTLLTSALNSTLAASRGFSTPPYAGFPTTLTVAQSLRPFPQFGSIGVSWAPVGDSWYNSAQFKVTKRLSHGLEFGSVFTWQKELTTAEGAAVNDVYNRPNQKTFSPYSMPFVWVTSYTYQLPAVGQNKFVQTLVHGWIFGGMMRYASGQPIPVPAANNALSSILFQNTFANRVAGQPLFLKSLNCHCVDPNSQFVLNPAAWSDPAAGTFGTSSDFYNDYRYQRRPDEQMSLARTFPIREKMTLQIRVEFFNVFNRTEMSNPTSTNALATQTRNSSGLANGGFGWISTASTYGDPRKGQLLARFEF